MSVADRVYRVLLSAYPPGFREAYGPEMALLVRDRRRHGGEGGIRFWLDIVIDLARTAPALRAEERRVARWNATLRMEGWMKRVGLLVVLIGLIQSVNAAIELSARGNARTGLESSAVVLAIAVGLLLVAAGIALLRRTPRATTLTRIAAVAWLVLAVIIRVVYPWMSIFTMLLAVVVPIALLVWLWRGQRPNADLKYD